MIKVLHEDEKWAKAARHTTPVYRRHCQRTHERATAVQQAGQAQHCQHWRHCCMGWARCAPHSLAWGRLPLMRSLHGPLPQTCPATGRDLVLFGGESRWQRCLQLGSSVLLAPAQRCIRYIFVFFYSTLAQSQSNYEAGCKAFLKQYICLQSLHNKQV